MKDHLLFDTTDATTMADTDSVGAYVRAADGTLITQTTISAKKGLDVNLINTSVAVTATDLDIRNLDYTLDNVAIKGSTGNQLVVNSDGSINVTGSFSTGDVALAATAIANNVKVLSVAGTAQTAVTSALASRKYLWIYNNDNTKVYIGSSSVSAANGFPVSPGSYLELRAGAAISPYFVGQTGKTPEIRTLELS